MPNDPAQEFDIWLRNEISLIRLDDSQFSEQVLKKIHSNQTATAFDWWTAWSWILCALTLASVLVQLLTQIDIDSLTGPIVESLILLIAITGATWQCQKVAVRGY
jgi:hypothetical protein